MPMRASMASPAGAAIVIVEECNDHLGGLLRKLACAQHRALAVNYDIDRVAIVVVDSKTLGAAQMQNWMLAALALAAIYLALRLVLRYCFPPDSR
jgi:hypothetical protein